MQDRPTALFLMGPTAAGKTELAVDLVEHGQCEIISVDSAQIYRDMDIGSATPDVTVLTRAPHHLINICDPTESYSAAQFRIDALEIMEDIVSRGKTPLLTGGTMLYFKSLVESMANMPKGDPGLRQDLWSVINTQGLAVLIEELKVVDPVAFQKIDLNNPQRVQRAIEVYRLSGRPISSFWAEGQHDGKGRLAEAALDDFPYRVVQYAVIPEDRKILHKRIEQRFDQMLNLGFEEEVRALYQRGDLHLDLPSIRSVGYRQMWNYFDGDLDYASMRERGIIATRQLAKRQLTWLRGWSNLERIDTTCTPINRLSAQIRAQI